MSDREEHPEILRFLRKIPEDAPSMRWGAVEKPGRGPLLVGGGAVDTLTEVLARSGWSGPPGEDGAAARPGG